MGGKIRIFCRKWCSIHFCRSWRFGKAAVTFKDGEWKIRKDNAWAENLGDDGGKLVANGPNIGATAGQYIVTFNEAEMTYKVEANQNVWGIVGSGVHNGWGGPNVKGFLTHVMMAYS